MVVSSFWLLWLKLLWTLWTCFCAKNTLSFLWDKCSRVTAGSYGRSTFGFKRHCPAIFQSSSTIFHSHQHCMSNPVSLHPHQQQVLQLFYFFLAILSVLTIKIPPQISKMFPRYPLIPRALYPLKIASQTGLNTGIAWRTHAWVLPSQILV